MARRKKIPGFRATLNCFGGRTNGRKCRQRQGCCTVFAKQPAAALGVDVEWGERLAQVKCRQFELHQLTMGCSWWAGLCGSQTLGQNTVTIAIHVGLVLVAAKHLFVIAQIGLVMTPYGQLAQYRHEQSTYEQSNQECTHHATNIRLNRNKRCFIQALLVNMLKSKRTNKTLCKCRCFGTGL